MADEFRIFSGSAHRELAGAIAARLGVDLGAAETIRFSNENLKVKVLENVRAKDVFVVQPSFPPVSEGIVELLILIDALRSASAGRITAVTPYFPYVRSDKKDEPRISITARLMADLLRAAGADRVLTLDLHSPQIQGFFRMPSDHLTAVPILCEHLRGRDRADWVVVAADAGEAKDAARWARLLLLPLAIIDKRRSGDDERPRAVAVVGDVAGKHALVVDDEVATGGTLREATEFLLARGARSVSAAAVHPVLSGPAPEFVRSSRLDELVVTDSLPVPPAKRSPKLHVVSVAPLLAEAIARIHDGRGVSEMYR